MKQPVHPAVEWLEARLLRAPAPPQEIRDEATAIQILPEELLNAVSVLRVRIEPRVSEAGVRYSVWLLPTTTPGQFKRGKDSRRFSHPTALELERPEAPKSQATGASVEVLPNKTAKQLKDPKTQVEKAKATLQRNAPRFATYLNQLTRVASDDAPACPTCGRGTPRGEELRLKAISTALDRAGVVAARGATEAEGNNGPTIVFPPGTRIAILAGGSSEEPERPLPQLRRADQIS